MSDPAVPSGTRPESGSIERGSEVDVSPRWEYGGRVYIIWKVTDDHDGSGWEVEDIGPVPGRGVVLEIFADDADGEFTFTAFTDRPLPFALVRRFITEAAREIAAD